MTRPQDFEAAHDAIYAALTTSTGKPRALMNEHLFLRLRRPKDDAGAAYGQTLIKPACLVRIGNLATATDHVNCDHARYVGTVEIVRFYRPGKDLFDAETDASMKRALADTHRVAQALTYPTALDTSSSGQDTGIDGGCLHMTGHSTQGPDLDERNSVVRCVDRFTVSITLASVDL